jgi:hypothetical protein
VGLNQVEKVPPARFAWQIELPAELYFINTREPDLPRG